MSRIMKAYFDTPEGQVHYRYSKPAETVSQPRVPILLLHMSATSSVCFERLMRLFTAAGHPCFAPDMPGFGESFDPASDPPSLRWFADMYAAFTTTVVSSRDGAPVHIVGHHTGAPLGVELAVAYPHLARSLVLLGPVVMTKEQRQASLERFAPPAFNEPVADGSHLIKTWDYLKLPGRVPGEQVAMRCVFSHDGYDMLPRVGCMVLGACARDDVLWGTFAQAKEVRPDMEAHEVKGGNYEPDVGAESVAAVALPFFERAEKK